MILKHTELNGFLEYVVCHAAASLKGRQKSQPPAVGCIVGLSVARRGDERLIQIVYASFGKSKLKTV
jgi:hypothetical protein